MKSLSKMSIALLCGIAAGSGTQAETHGFIPAHAHQVTEAIDEAGPVRLKLYMDVHHVGAGKVTAADVAAAHERDLATQREYGVRFINYWVDPHSGVVFCLSEAESPEAVLATHRKAHGLISDEIAEVTPGD